MLATESIRLEINVPARMRDGTVLYADIYRPEGAGSYPALLARLPYNKGAGSGTGGYMNPLRFVRAGYAVVLQDCRGTGVSEGRFYPLTAESEDGYDTVEWVARQVWCNGRVGMYGLSYLGFNQWAAAVAQPPHLRAIAPFAITILSRKAQFLNEGGAFRLNNLLNWYLGMGLSTLLRSQLPAEQATTARERLCFMIDHFDASSRFLPLKDMAAAEMVVIGMARFLSDYINHVEDEEYWRPLLSPPPLERVLVPAFHLSGWWEDNSSGVLASYGAMQARGGSELARKNQKLVMGPWTHSTELPSRVGDLDFGVAASGTAIDVGGQLIRWFDHWLKGIENGIMEEPRVRIFVMGENRWREENEWPLARTRYTPYYFHSGVRANSRTGDGWLSPEPPREDEEADVYLYDPRNPVPTIGGLNGPAPGVFEVQDQREVEERGDVLVYTSAVLDREIEATGPVQVRLYASSSAVDTDFTGKLVDVWPDGRAYNLVDGIIRARYRESLSHPQFLEPGRVYEYCLDLRATSNVFKAGHRIRVQISSSNFPKWDRNLNTGHAIGQDAEMQVAVQTIYHNSIHPSHVVLPITPR